MHIPLDDDLRRFGEYSAALGLSERTLEHRASTLAMFSCWCVERSVMCSQEISRSMLEQYRRYLFHYRRSNDQPLSLATQKNHLSNLKQFFKWLAAHNYIAFDPASSLQLPKQHRRLPRAILTPQEVVKVMQAADKGPNGLRDRAILETLYATGIRRMELANLSLYDIDPEQRTLMVREGKGRKDRLIPIGMRACGYVVRYVQELRGQLVSGGSGTSLFLTDYGEPFIKNRLSALVKRLLRAAGIDKTGACHLFRHAMATHMLNNGADLRFIQVMLGHADISTTTIYTQVSIRELQAVYERTHPLNIEAVIKPSE